MERWLKEIIERLTTLYNKKYSSTNLGTVYTPLSPTDDADNSSEYLDALKWALDNKHKIKNVAITGPYGSGKSSVLQTFQRKYKFNSCYKFLNVSLATFKDEKGNSGTNGLTENEALRLIELSVLQQIFYHESDANVPDSRFLRISKRNKKLLFVSAFFSVTTLSCFLYVVFPKFFSSFTVFGKIEIEEIYVKRLAVATIISVLIYLSYRLFSFAKGIVVKKIGINNSEIEVDQGISKSILNKHLDEILYFFEVTDYNIVVIEDLDRFEQTEVFTKLREINLLLNNSKKIGKHIVFIYAIRDEMFRDKERVKFFDFILPIIPVINSSNSNEKIIKIIEKNEYTIAHSLIDDISMFIDDMRLLYNVMNEYHVYHEKIDKNLSQEKLLSIILYKNMYPGDFSSLNRGAGLLYNIIKDKNIYVSDELRNIDNEISLQKNRLKEIEEVKLRNIAELRAVYILACWREIKDNVGHQAIAFNINGSQCDLHDAVKDDKFTFIKSNPIQYFYPQGYSHSLRSKFSDIEKKVDSKFSYAEREALLSESSEKAVDSRRKKIQELEKSKVDLKREKMQSLLNRNMVKFPDSLENSTQKDLLSLLLRKGYIDEDYLDYISIFYEGSLSRGDYDFLIALKSQRALEFNFRLDKIENLLKKIDFTEFDKSYILNFYLVNYLLKNRDSIPLKRIFQQLANGSAISVRFIDEYYALSEDTAGFINNLCKNWQGIWSYIEDDSEYSEQKKSDYFRAIVAHADVNNIRKIFEGRHEAFSRYDDFLLDESLRNKSFEIFRVLALKLSQIHKDISAEMLKFVYDNSHYIINVENVNLLMSRLNKEFSNLFYTQNYSYICESNLENLIEYIEDDINSYLENIYFKIDLNREDPESKIIELLKNDSVNNENKMKLAEYTNTKIHSVDDIDDAEIFKILFKSRKLAPSWASVVGGYICTESKFSQEMNDYLNDLDISKELGRAKISKSIPDEETAKGFIRGLILNKDLTPESYRNILDSVPYLYNSLPVESLSSEKVHILIEKKTLSSNSTNYLYLKEHFPKLRTSLIEISQIELLKGADSFTLDLMDVTEIIFSRKVSDACKESLLSHYGFDFFQNDRDLLSEFAKIFLRVDRVNVSSDILKKVILKNDLAASERIELFTKYNSHFENDEITEFLSSLPEPYASVAQKGKMPKLDKDKLNLNFAEVLKEKSYISSFKQTLMGKIWINTKKK